VPPRIRLVAGLATVAALMVLFGTTNELAVLMDLDAYLSLPLDAAGLEPIPRLFLELQQTQLRLRDSHRGLSVAVLFFLSMATGFVFAAALRFLRPGMMPLGGLRKLLARAALAAALLYTVDGAQEAAVARKTAVLVTERFPKMLAAAPSPTPPQAADGQPKKPNAAEQEEAVGRALPALGWMLPLTSVFKTALFALLFAWVGRYFQAASVQRAVEALDRELPSGE
jgi:hypothetical protein